MDSVKPQIKRGRKKKQVPNVAFLNQGSDMSLGSVPHIPKDTVFRPEDTGPSHNLSFGGLEIKVRSQVIPDPRPEVDYKETWAKTRVQSIEKKTSVKYISAIKKDIRMKPLSNVYVSCKEGVLSDIVSEKTDVCCWWCCHKFCTEPCFLPTSEDELKNRIIVIGNFCSWQCVKAFNSSLKDFNTSNRSYILRKMLKNLGETDKIETAPPRELLKMFGGPLTINEFRNPNVGTYRLLSSQNRAKTILLETVFARKLTSQGR